MELIPYVSAIICGFLVLRNIVKQLSHQQQIEHELSDKLHYSSIELSPVTIYNPSYISAAALDNSPGGISQVHRDLNIEMQLQAMMFPTRIGGGSFKVNPTPSCSYCGSKPDLLIKNRRACTQCGAPA